MTFPSLRRVLLAAPFVLAVTVASIACGPPPRPGTNPPCSLAPVGISLPAPHATPQAVAPCPSTTAYIAPTQISMPASTPPLAPLSSTGNSTWTFFIQQDKLQVQTSDGMSANCDRMSILVTGVDPVEVARTGQQLRLSSGKDVPGGSFLQATADRVTRSGLEGAMLTLEGNAKLTCVRLNKKAELSADRISINLVSGQITSEMGMMQPVSPVLAPAAPCMPSVPQPAIVPTTGTSNSAPDVTQWQWMGFFR